MSQLVIDVKNLSKRFNSVTAVDNISFNVERGKTCALLGANGAGKTTTLAMLLGLLLPDTGQIHVLGKDMLHDRYQVLHRMNYSSPYADLPQRLTVTENLTVYARLYGIENTKQRLAELMDELDITQFAKRTYRSLSAGQRTRVLLAKALLNKPELLILDEPTASLDPDTADRIRRYLQQYQQHTSAAIILASHNMPEVEQLCDNVFIMHQGRITDSGSPTELITRFGKNSLEQVFLDVARNTGST